MSRNMQVTFHSGTMQHKETKEKTQFIRAEVESKDNVYTIDFIVSCGSLGVFGTMVNYRDESEATDKQRAIITRLYDTVREYSSQLYGWLQALECGDVEKKNTMFWFFKKLELSI